MKMKTLIAVAVAGAFAVPFAAQASADNDRLILAQAGAPGGTGTGFPPTDLQQLDVDGLDSDKDTYVSREEAAKDERLMPHFQAIDKDNDGRISRAEWAMVTGGTAAGATTAPSGPAADQRTAAQRPKQHRGLPYTGQEQQDKK